MYEILGKLLKKYGVTAYRVSKETGVPQSTLSDWKRGISTPKQDKLKKIADYFGVTLEYLMTGKEASPKSYTAEFNTWDERDIKKDFDSIIQKLTAGADGPAAYDGVPLAPEAADLFKDELEIALRRLKLINKDDKTLR